MATIVKRGGTQPPTTESKGEKTLHTLMTGTQAQGSQSVDCLTY